MIDLSGYVPVNERLKAALEKYPQMSIIAEPPVVVSIGGVEHIASTVRLSGDCPDIQASAWEPFPGTTPYTRGSEAMNAETSALGRALGFLGFGLDKAIASAEDVANRQGGSEPGQPRLATEKQKSYASKLLLATGERMPSDFELLTAAEMSCLIERLVARQAELRPAPAPGKYPARQADPDLFADEE